jgi:hypothetical protein
MRTFKTKSFARFAKNQGIGDPLLRQTAKAAETHPDADLGGEVFKQRIARAGEGKSGGYRVIILLRKGNRAVFIHGFAKKDAANVTAKELKRLKELARIYLNATAAEIDRLVAAGELTEI